MCRVWGNVGTCLRNLGPKGSFKGVYKGYYKGSIRVLQ